MLLTQEQFKARLDSKDNLINLKVETENVNLGPDFSPTSDSKDYQLVKDNQAIAPF